MADYIDKNILLQAYVHIEVPGNLPQKRLEELRLELTRFAEARGRFFIYPEVEVELEFKEGSLKSYLTIAGMLYAAISGYGGFRSGVDYLYTDIKRLSDTLVAESLFVTKARHDRIIRTEARVGIIGSLKHLVDQIKSIEASLGAVPVDEVAWRIRRLHEDAESLLRNVKAEEDAQLIEEEMISTAMNLPTRCPYPKKRKPTQPAIQQYNDALVKLRKRFGRPSKKKP